MDDDNALNDTFNDCYISNRESLLQTQNLVEVQQLVLDEEGMDSEVEYIDNGEQFNRMTFGNGEEAEVKRIT